jgi:outer membrane receptor protein involved in Fe transport
VPAPVSLCQRICQLIITTSATTLILASALAGPPAEARSLTYALDIPAQTLGTALEQLAAQSHHKLFFRSDLVEGRTSPALKGEFTAEEAIGQLLSGTGLIFEIRPSETVLIKERSSEVLPASGYRTSLLNDAVESQASREGATEDRLEEIVVSAQKKSERLQDVPVPVSVLNADMLASNSQLLLRDYYSSVPALNVSPSLGGNQTLSIRGVTTGGLSTPTVGVLIDDVPFGGGNNQVPDIDPNDLARLEVLRGPQGTLYGANSMGGLLKYVTKDPSPEEFRGHAEAGITRVHDGDDMGYNVRASANVPLSETLAVRLSGFKRSDPGYIDDPIFNRTDINSAQAAGGRLSALWHASENFSLKLTSLYQRIEGDGLPEVDVLPSLGDLEQNHVIGSSAYERTIRATNATLKATLGTVDLTSVTGYNVNRFTVGADFSRTFFGDDVRAHFGVDGAPLVEKNTISKFTQELRASVPLAARLEGLFGAFYSRERSQDYQYAAASVPSTGEVVGIDWEFFGPSALQEYAAFASLTYEITDRFDVQFGGRESHVEVSHSQVVQSGPLVGPAPSITPPAKASSDTFTYLVTPRFKVTPELMVYARLASGFRPGGPNAISGVPQEYDPDTTRTYEVGAKADFLDQRLSLDASLYYIDWQDIQLSLRNPQRLTYMGNGSAAKSQGVELSISSRPLRGLSVSGWVVYDDAVLTEDIVDSPTFGLEGDRLPNTSEWSGSVSLEQELALSERVSASVGGSFTYVGDRIGPFTGTPQRQNFGSYTRTDLHAGLKYDDWSASLFVNNVSDARGMLNGGVGYVFPSEFIYIQPRTVGLSIARRF